MKKILCKFFGHKWMKHQYKGLMPAGGEHFDCERCGKIIYVDMGW